jgi:hypothetical protein
LIILDPPLDVGLDRELMNRIHHPLRTAVDATWYESGTRGHAALGGTFCLEPGIYYLGGGGLEITGHGTFNVAVALHCPLVEHQPTAERSHIRLRDKG